MRGSRLYAMRAGRKAAVGTLKPVAAVFVTLLLFLPGIALVGAEDLPATRFTDSMSSCIDNILKNFDFRRGLPAAAATTQQALRDMRDPRFHYGIEQHRFDFPVLIWLSGIHPAYSTTLKLGKSSNYPGLPRTIAKGMITFTRCNNPHPPEVPETGPLGWPCAKGGAVGATTPGQAGVQVNVLAFFFPMQFRLKNLNLKRDWFSNTANTCIGKKPFFDAWDLSKLAACMYNEFPTGYLDKGCQRLHGVAVFPIYKGTGSLEERQESYALAAQGGRICFEERKVTKGFSGSPIDQLTIGFVGMLSMNTVEKVSLANGQ